MGQKNILMKICVTIYKVNLSSVEYVWNRSLAEFGTVLFLLLKYQPTQITLVILSTPVFAITHTDVGNADNAGQCTRKNKCLERAGIARKDSITEQKPAVHPDIAAPALVKSL